MTRLGNGIGTYRLARKTWFPRLSPRGPFLTGGRPPRGGPPRCRQRRNARCDGRELFAPVGIVTSARRIGFLSATPQETRRIAQCPTFEAPPYWRGLFLPNTERDVRSETVPSLEWAALCRFPIVSLVRGDLVGPRQMCPDPQTGSRTHGNFVLSRQRGRYCCRATQCSWLVVTRAPASE